ncbi:hypothetical protein [Micromonospora inositola]|uniref:Uncharacterized protein n=1 Tax=Micromonospora inositola TaxID=47865 RepID=A0A1C5IRP3_9ACTN|nr:hypothetical protein [Micromonospora inositola]SCG60990.1 hypothetical protein GA0070613_3331 [Micromonospora inositola]
MADRDLLDALSGMQAASKGIDAVLAAARDGRGELDPMLIDVEGIERHRERYRMELDYFERSYRG